MKESLMNNVELKNDNVLVKFDKVFYTNKEMIKMLDCTEKTLRKYRNDGYLGYSKVGDKYYYTADGIYLFLKNAHVDPYQYS